MHSLATAISGNAGKLDRLDAAPHRSIDEDSQDSGETIQPRAPAWNVNPLGELERLLEERPLEELERLLREHSLGSAARTPSEGLHCPKRGSMNNQEYLEFVAILEDTRNRVETVLSELPVNGATKARLKRVAADLERAAQAYRDKSNA